MDVLSIPKAEHDINAEFIRQNNEFVNSKISKIPATEINEMKMIFEPNRK